MISNTFNNTEGDYILYERSNLPLTNECEQQGYLIKIHRYHKPSIVKKCMLTDGRQYIMESGYIVHGIHPSKCSITDLWRILMYPDHILHIAQKNYEHRDSAG